MASQFDELRLQVSLVDNATAQLKSIKSSLDELGTGSQANNLDRLKRETGEVDAALRKMVDTALRGPKAFLDLARSVTVAGVSLGTFAYAADKTLGTVSALSSKLVELLHISRQTGFDPAVIKQITQAYERSGLSARQAQQEMAGFSSSLADFAQINSKVRQGIEAGFGNQKELIGRLREMYDAIDRAPDTIGKFNTMKDHANAIFEEFKGKGQESLGKIIRDRILNEFKTPGALNVTETIKPVTDAMSAHLKKQIASAEEYEKVTIRISQNWTAIANTMKFDVMNSGLIKGLKWLDDFMEKWKKAAQAPKAAPKPAAAPELTGEPKEAADAFAAGARRIGGRRGRANQPQQLLGDGGTGGNGGGGRTSFPEIPAIGDALKAGGGAPIMLPQASGAAGWRGLPMSTNIEDRRGENLLETQNDETKTLISEMRRLNALLSGEERPQGQKFGALAMPGGGRAGLPGGGSGYPGGGGGPPGGGGGTPPGGTTPGGTIQPPPIPGPYGQPMPAWGATTAGFGGGTGGGAAGGVPGLPGSPSGPAAPRTSGGAAPGGGTPGTPGSVGPAGSADAAIVEAAKAYGLDPNTMRSVADIESSTNPGSNRNARTQYKGLFQINQGEFQQHGGGDIYNARDNANAAAKLFAGNRDWFTKQYGRAPTDGELYLMHLQGRGFFTNRTMTNVAGNPYPGMKGPQTPESFLAGWSQRVERGKQRALAEHGRGPGTPQTPGPTAGTPQTAVGVPGAGAVTHSGSGGAVPESLRQQLEYAGLAAGVRTDVAHGIEPGHARHTRGAPAGDVDFFDPVTNRKLDVRNPADQARMATYVEAAAAAGASGIGFGKDGSYMGFSRMHVGGGTAAVWGAGGKGANAPEWLRSAYERGVKRRMDQQELVKETARLREQQQKTQVAGPGAPTGTPPVPTQTTPPDNPTTSLYEKLKQLEDAQKARTRVDLKEARDRIDAMNAKKSVAGTGDITVKVKPERTRTGTSGILKKVPMHRLTQGEKASPGPPQPTAATGASHDPSLDS